MTTRQHKQFLRDLAACQTCKFEFQISLVPRLCLGTRRKRALILMNLRRIKLNLSSWLAITAVGFTTTYAVYCAVDYWTVLDYTWWKSSICEVHRTRMSKQLVPAKHGMPPFNTDWRNESDARNSLFPHADEPRKTGYCSPARQNLARIYVCPHCTNAKASWLKQRGSRQSISDIESALQQRLNE